MSPDAAPSSAPDRSAASRAIGARPRRVELVVNEYAGHTDEALAALRELSAEQTVLQAAASEAGRLERADGVELVDGQTPRPDLCVVLGGDGTILRALERFAGTDVPVFAVNFGRIGFLATVEREQLAEGMRCALEGRCDIMELPGLETELSGRRRLALNDISFGRRPQQPVAELSYRLGGEEVGHVRCDGLVAATPAGSTGYNLANGGPVMAWGVEGFAVSFIAPHTLTARALVVAPDDVLYVRNSARRGAVTVGVDGVPRGKLAVGEEVAVRFCHAASRLAQMPGTNFYQRLRDKFGLLAQ